MKIDKNIEMLEISQGGKTIYPVLLWDNKDVILIDTGLPGQIELFYDAIKQANISPESITAVLLTHHDVDHIGCAKIFSENGTKIYAHKDEVSYIDGRETSPKLVNMEKRINELSDTEKEFYNRVKPNAHLFYVDVDEQLTDGQIIPLCGGIKVTHTPGHTPGHIVLHLLASDILVVGDAANIDNGVLVGANPQHTLDIATAEKSLDKIKLINAPKIVCYHGGLLINHA